MIDKLLLAFWILQWTSFSDPTVGQRFSSLDESLDESNDAEIFRAVVESMKQWTLHKKLHHRGKREVSKVCYEDIGCFEDTGPFSYLEMLPSPPKDVGTRFLVYGSRKARSIPMEVSADDINDNANRAIDPDLPTKVIVHGFGSDCNHLWVYDMRSALMSIHECNIVCVDWGPGSAVPNYVRAAANTRLVGRQLAKLIRSLNVPLEKVHLIGFSLGAHVAGFAGAELGNVSRITGLDPAGPLFELQDTRARLDAADANFVDVIHSNGEQLLLGGLGSWQPMGDVDYYPNGGKMQSGCSNIFLGAVSDIIWSSTVEGRSLCNHRRAYKFFTDSVSPKCRFPAFPCDHGYEGLLKGDCFPCGVSGTDRPCGDMGYYSDESSARGQLYLVTRDEEPFCAHQYQIKVYNSRGERSTRNYGKLQVTLVGEGSYNDTFSMTHKDEELLVGAILQKIVVPHPAITNLEAIEIKYTAYSGWISSGLVSWNVDKITIIDSFGKTLSICKKGLILESARPVYLPLYPGECNIPLDTDNVTTTSSIPMHEAVAEEKQGGIGPFTKEQNYETKDTYSVEILPSDRSMQRRGYGPYTKEQNVRVNEGEMTFNSPNPTFGEAENHRIVTNPWTVLDISNDGVSNSLENTESERGRGFSDSNLIYRTSTAVEYATETTTIFVPEIKEPVLRPNKKQGGRSLKLPEITEPILSPRPARQNTQNDMIVHEKARDEIQETSSTSTRAFTVQFLPERLADILAQAERYARQTLLPLISQYTPSFVTGIKHDEPKYFPLLSDIIRQKSNGTSTEVNNRRDNDPISDAHQSEIDKSFNLDNGRYIENASILSGQKQEEKNVYTVSKDAEGTMIIEAVYPEKIAAVTANLSNVETRMPTANIQSEGGNWQPINQATTTIKENLSRKDLNVSRSLNWPVDFNHNQTSQTAKLDSQVIKADDWIPITVKNNLVSSTTVRSAIVSDKVTNVTSTVKEIDIIENSRDTDERTLNEAKKVITSTYERKFIPLIDLKQETSPSPSTDSNDIPESRSSTTAASHIQKIPRYKKTGAKSARTVRPTIMFPYAYERKNDPGTRYIPLIPQEDMGNPYWFSERNR